MKHFLLKLLCFATLMGCGNAWAEEVTIATFSNSSNEGWTIEGSPSYSNTGGYQLVANSMAIITPELLFSNYTNITIQITARKYGGPNATQGEISVKQGEKELVSYSPSSTSLKASGKLEISPSNGQLKIYCPGASSSKGCGISEIKIFGNENAIDDRTSVNIMSFSANNTTLIKGGQTNTFVANDQNSWTASYNYTSSNTDVATVNESGVITAVSKGSARITVSLNIANNDANYKVGTTASKYVDITVKNPSHTAQFSVNGDINHEDDKEIEEGESITFPSDPEDIDSKKFVGWTKTADYSNATTAPSDLYKAATMGDDDVTYYAVFATADNSGSQWRKVAASAVKSAGVYAIITTDGHAFNGTISSGNGQLTSTAFSFDANGIAASAPIGTCEITFTAVTGGYTMYNADKGYLYASAASSGKLAWHNTESSYWLYKSSNWLYNSNSAYLRDYQNSSIRTYGSNNGSVIQFAKKESSISYSNYCTTVSASYTVTIDTPEGGTISAKVGGSNVDSGTRLEAGTTVSLEPIADQDYTFSSWNVSSKSGSIEVTDNSFEMPAEAVTISAVFQASGVKQLPLSFEGYQESTVWLINADWSSNNDKGSKTAYYKIYKENSIETPLMNFDGCVTAKAIVKMRTEGGVSGNSAILSVKFNETELGTIKAENTTLTDYIFDIVDLPSGNGHLVFSVPEGTSENGVGIQAISIEGSNKPAAPVITPASCVFEEQKEITIEKRGSAEVKIFYTTDGTDPTAESNKYTAPFSINTTCTIKAVAILNGEISDVVSAEYTYLDLSNCDTYTWAAADAGFTNAYKISELSFGDFLGAVLNKNDDGATEPAYYTSGANVRLYGNNTMKISSNYKLVIRKLVMNYTLNKISTDKFTTSDGALSFDTKNKIATWVGNSKDITFTNTNNSGYFAISKIEFYYELEKEPITIASSVGYATCVTNSALDFSTMGENLKAYKVKVNVEEGEVMLVPVTEVPANKAIVVKGDITTHEVPVLNSTEETMLDNDLQWSDTKVEVPSQYTHYVLAIRDEKACFAPVAVGSKIGVRKGYFVVDNSEAPTFRIAIESEEGNSTSLNTVETTYNADVVFNLTGQRVEKISKSGLYIVNGNKVVIK